MCGLILAPSRHALKMDAALQAMNYRGQPDKFPAQFMTMGKWTIGHTRLAIQDLSPMGMQPFLTSSRMIAFVGEIMNHYDRGEQAVLKDALESIDFAGFHALDGFWSIVETDGKEASAFTDHTGVKPLYYWPEHGIVCSEIRPMFELVPPPPLNRSYLQMLTRHGLSDSWDTPWIGIYQVPPGTRLQMNGDGTFLMQRYWHWNLVPTPWQPSLEDVRDTVSNAIGAWTLSDLPVALLLSGGIDSSIIYYVLKARGFDPRCFSAPNNESHFLPPGIAELSMPPVLPEEAVRVMQSPQDLGSLLPQIQLARAVAAEGFHVCLSGDGADEAFGGYSRSGFYDSQVFDLEVELPIWHLPRLDRVMMRSTIELRSPFLSPSVMALARKLPREWRTDKWALRKAFKGLVPDEILERAKKPLKSAQMKEGGEHYRAMLLDHFLKENDPCLTESLIST